MKFLKRSIEQDDRPHRNVRSARARIPSEKRRLQFENLEDRTLLTPAPNARPTGGVVAAGSAAISQTPATTDIVQSSQRAVINWQSFNVGSQQTVELTQPSSSSVALFRVEGSNASQIAGHIDSNGQVILVNSNGVDFDIGSQVSASSVIATTAGIKNSNFMGGRMDFSQPGGKANAVIVNHGTITAVQEGLVGLVGPKAENTGAITAHLGTVTLQSGDTFTLDTFGTKWIAVLASASGHLTSQRASNSGTIQADGGTVSLSAAAGGVVDTLVTNSGTITANTAANQTGQIVLAAASTGGSQATNSGTLTASGTPIGLTGGYVTVTADNVKLIAGSVIDVAGSAGGGYVKVGGDFHGQAGTQTALNTTVQSGATIDASAITSGNGGMVAVWSEQKTVFDGAITAKGGANSGNGGYVETAGHTLVIKGSVDVSAPHGGPGTWLKN